MRYESKNIIFYLYRTLVATIDDRFVLNCHKHLKIYYLLKSRSRESFHKTMKEYSKIVHKSDKTRKKNVRIETIGFEKLYKK